MSEEKYSAGVCFTASPFNERSAGILAKALGVQVVKKLDADVLARHQVIINCGSFHPALFASRKSGQTTPVVLNRGSSVRELRSMPGRLRHLGRSCLDTPLASGQVGDARYFMEAKGFKVRHYKIASQNRYTILQKCDDNNRGFFVAEYPDIKREYRVNFFNVGGGYVFQVLAKLFSSSGESGKTVYSTNGVKIPPTVLNTLITLTRAAVQRSVGGNLLTFGYITFCRAGSNKYFATDLSPAPEITTEEEREFFVTHMTDFLVGFYSSLRADSEIELKKLKVPRYPPVTGNPWTVAPFATPTTFAVEGEDELFV